MLFATLLPRPLATPPEPPLSEPNWPSSLMDTRHLDTAAKDALPTRKAALRDSARRKRAAAAVVSESSYPPPQLRD